MAAVPPHGDAASPDRSLLEYFQRQEAGATSRSPSPLAFDAAESACPSGRASPDAVQVSLSVHSKADLPNVVTLECWHSVPAPALRLFVQQCVERDGFAGSVPCPVGRCGHVLQEWELRAVLPAGDFDKYLMATLTALIASPTRASDPAGAVFVRCPNSACGVVR